MPFFHSHVRPLKQFSLTALAFISAITTSCGPKHSASNSLAKNANTKTETRSKVLQIAAGGYHTCALTEDGVKCWGYKRFGQTNVPYLKAPKAVTAGGYHTCALTEDGVKCWGYNRYGQTDVPMYRWIVKSNQLTNHCSVT